MQVMIQLSDKKAADIHQSGVNVDAAGRYVHARV